MGEEVINLAEKRAELDEMPNLRRKAFRAIREHLKRTSDGYGCIHNVDKQNEQWALLFSYRPRRKSVAARVTMSVSYADADSKQDVRIAITNKRQTKSGFFALAATREPVIRFSYGSQEELPAMVIPMRTEIIARPPEVTKQDLLQAIQLVHSPLDLDVFAGLSMPEDWAGGRSPSGA